MEKPHATLTARCGNAQALSHGAPISSSVRMIPRKKVRSGLPSFGTIDLLQNLQAEGFCRDVGVEAAHSAADAPPITNSRAPSMACKCAPGDNCTHRHMDLKSIGLRRRLSGLFIRLLVPKSRLSSSPVR
jgi:hypothetical protein